MRGTFCEDTEEGLEGRERMVAVVVGDASE